MKFIFIYKLSSEAQKFNFSLAWFFLFKSNHYFWFVWELVWLSLSYMKSKRPPNFHSTSSAALGLTCLFQEALRLRGWWCTPSYPRTQEQMPSARFWPGISGFAAFRMAKQSTTGPGLCFTRKLEKAPPEPWHSWADPLGNLKPKPIEGAQFAKYASLYEHSTRQVSLRKTLNRFKGRREEDTQRILEVKVSGRESALLDSTGPFTLSLRERTLFWRFLAKRALLIFHNAASLRLATLVLTAVIALEKELDVIFFNGLCSTTSLKQSICVYFRDKNTSFMDTWIIHLSFMGSLI